MITTDFLRKPTNHNKQTTMSAPPKKCGILFSPGAFHRASCFDIAKQKLEAAGFGPVLVSTHPSLGEDARGKTMFDDAGALREQMRPYVEDDDGGCEFIVIGHSYGGFPAFAATEGWSVKERAAAAAGGAGKKVGGVGGVRSIVFMAATAPLVPGSTAIGLFEPGKEEEFVYPPFFDHGPPGMQGHIARPNANSKPAFYNDMSAEDADRYESLLLPASQDAFETPVTYTVGDSALPKYYIVTERDATVPPENQRALAAAIPGCVVMSMDSGHCGFITQVDRFVELVRSIAA
ncbi:Alpha/beta hydrolase fold-1 [Xylariomycetidae sp. FL2044]|nr:Alpha/beta hydrolase fold-1 [Xylariomycetidae sp. FL2044]